MTQPLQSWLPQGGQNLFQAVKAMCAEAKARNVRLWQLTIGQPQGAPPQVARRTASLAVLSGEESYHGYQDNGCVPLPDFAKRFVLAHLPAEARERVSQQAFLPIPGIKPMLGLVPLACGHNVKVGTMTKPGYPTPADQCRYLGINHYALKTHHDNKFRFKPDWTPVYGEGDVEHHTNLIMTNFPHNPTGQIATREYWEELCDFCAKNGIRLFNDAAYAFLTFTHEVCALAEVAIDFPMLSWMEAYSASKSIGNGTGWRVGAIIGSADFVGDLATVKGNTDSGFSAPLALGALSALTSARPDLKQKRDLYKIRLDILLQILQGNGLRLAVEPQAGFFSLWLTPREAFGREVQNSTDFNRLMIANTGIAGVHFDPRYIRYAVAGAPLEEPSWQEALNDGFRLAQVLY